MESAGVSEVAVAMLEVDLLRPFVTAAEDSSDGDSRVEEIVVTSSLGLSWACLVLGLLLLSRVSGGIE